VHGDERLRSNSKLEYPLIRMRSPSWAVQGCALSTIKAPTSAREALPLRKLMRASYEAKVIAVSSLCSFLKSLGLDAVRLERAGALRARAALRDVWSPILSPPWTEPPR